MEFVETSVFHDFVRKQLGEEDFREIQSALIENPKVGKIQKRSGGARKMRWAGKGSGKSGGFRIIYYFAPTDERCYMLMGFGKGEKDNLTDAQLNMLREYIKRHLK